MNKDNRNNEQIYGRNDMIMLDQNNKIYGSLGLADRYVMKTEEGTRLMLSNPKLGRFDDVLTEFNIYGMSKQERTTGAQLYDMDTRLNVDGIEYEKNGTSYTVNIVKISGNLLYGVPFQFSKEDVDATLSVSQFSNLEQPNVRINLLDSEGNVVGTLWAKNAEKEISAKCSKIRFDWSKGGKFIVSDLMLNFGNTALPYEPYTGGKPSPSPEYPQEIVSVGGNGSIEVNVRGKNLVDVYGYSANGIPNPEAERVLFNTYGTTLSTTEKTDKLIVHQEIIDGETANSYTSGYFCIGINKGLEDGKKYKVSFDMEVLSNPLGVSSVGVMFNGNSYYMAEITEKRVITTALYEAYGERQYIEIRNSGMSLEISNFMITEKDENTIYEPYYEPQSIFISTPTGLPAIPVDSDGNYTDANGQQWIADYVDLKRGKLYKKVTRLNLKDVDATSIAHGFHSNGNGYLSFSVKNVSKEHQPISNRYRGSKWTQTSGYTYIPNSNTIVFVDDRFTDKQTAIKLVQDTYVIYALTSQIETDLTPEEIQAYKNLVTYARTTIVENNYNTWMKATYKSIESA